MQVYKDEGNELLCEIILTTGFYVCGYLYIYHLHGLFGRNGMPVSHIHAWKGLLCLPQG